MMAHITENASAKLENLGMGERHCDAMMKRVDVTKKIKSHWLMTAATDEMANST